MKGTTSLVGAFCLFWEGTLVSEGLERWHKAIRDKDVSMLSDMLADDAVFHSPVLHRPQEGKALTYMYLYAAFNVLAGDDFQYVGEYRSETGAVLEFKTIIDDIEINGVDIITWNDEGKISEFKVMLRPHKAMSKVQEMMASMLEKVSG